MVRDSEKVPFLSGSQYRSLFKTSECNGSPTNNIRDDPDGGRGRSICEELLVLFDWSTFLLILVFVLLGAAEMIGSPIWASSLVASRSDVSVKAFCFPIFASVIISAGALARWKIRRFGLSVISMFPFFYKQVIIYGVLVSVGMVLQAFCGLPTRTPAYLQAPTYIAAIIGAVGTAKILKRTSFSNKALLCILGILLLVGFSFIYFTISPGFRLETDSYINITLNNYNRTNTVKESRTSSLTATPNAKGIQWSSPEQGLWTLGFAMGHAFHGIALIFLEECLAEKGAHPLAVLMYAQLMTVCCVLCLFFFDIIPVYGMANNLTEFREHLHHGVKCLFGLGRGCGQIGWRGWLYMLIAIGNFVAKIYLVSACKSALFTILSMALSVPIVSLVWMCLGDTGINLIWFPTMSTSSLLIFVSLWTIFPLVLLYQHYSQKIRNLSLENF